MVITWKVFLRLDGCHQMKNNILEIRLIAQAMTWNSLKISNQSMKISLTGVGVVADPVESDQTDR